MVIPSFFFFWLSYLIAAGVSCLYLNVPTKGLFTRAGNILYIHICVRPMTQGNYITQSVDLRLIHNYAAWWPPALHPECDPPFSLSPPPSSASSNAAAQKSEILNIMIRTLKWRRKLGYFHGKEIG